MAALNADELSLVPDGSAPNAVTSNPVEHPLESFKLLVARLALAPIMTLVKMMVAMNNCACREVFDMPKTGWEYRTSRTSAAYWRRRRMHSLTLRPTQRCRAMEKSATKAVSLSCKTDGSSACSTFETFRTPVSKVKDKFKPPCSKVTACSVLWDSSSSL